MCVPSYFPPGTHEVHVTWSGVDSWGNSLPERIYTFDVINPLYGMYGDDPDYDQFKTDYPGKTVALLQDGRDSAELGITDYQGTGDVLIHGTHSVPDRNTDWTNYGGTDILEIGSYGQKHRSLVRFDLSAVPTDATIIKAYMKFYLYTSGQPQSREAFKMLKPWGEGIGNGSLYDNEFGKIRDGEASWLCSEYPTTWGAPGADQVGVDHDGAMVATSTCDDQAGTEKLTKVWVKWDITDAAQDWVANPAANFGLLLKVPGAESHSLFRSSDYSDQPFRPRLILVVDGAGGGTPNTPPTVDAGSNKIITLPTDTVSLNGTVVDPDDTPATAWTAVSGPAAVSFGNADAIDTTATFTAAGSYLLRLTADDGTNSAVYDSLTVTVNPDPSNDLDGDGLPDDWELTYFNDVLDCAPGIDTDTDGLTNQEEFNAGSDPVNEDTDGDGILDGSDPNPLVPNAPADPGEGTKGGCAPSSSSVPFALILLVMGLLPLFVRRRRSAF